MRANGKPHDGISLRERKKGWRKSIKIWLLKGNIFHKIKVLQILTEKLWMTSLYTQLDFFLNNKQLSRAQDIWYSKMTIRFISHGVLCMKFHSLVCSLIYAFKMHCT